MAWFVPSKDAALKIISEDLTKSYCPTSSAEKEFVKNNESKNISITPDILNSKTFKLFFIKTFLYIKPLSLLAF
jgi:hypothetical protein